MTPPSEPPLCECHGVAMRWKADSRTKARGQWICRVREREYRLEYQSRWREKRRNSPDHVKYCERENRRRRDRYASDPDYRERILARQRTCEGRKRENERRRTRRATDDEYRETENARRRKRYEASKQIFREKRRRQEGSLIPPGTPVLSISDARVAAHLLRNARKIESDRMLLKTVHHGDEKAQKMIALMFDESATEHEREVARQFLRQRRQKEWRPTQTTSAETPNTRHETKSPRALASSRGE